MISSEVKLIELISQSQKKTPMYFLQQFKDLRFLKSIPVCKECVSSICSLYYDCFFQKIKSVN